MGNRYSLYSASLVPTAGAIQVRQLISGGVQPGQSLVEIVPSGQLDRLATFLSMAQPMLAMTTNDLATILTNISITAGLKCQDGAVFRGQKRDIATGTGNGSFSASTDHLTWTSALGYAHITSISCQQGQPATVGVNYYALLDSESDFPLVEAIGALGGSAPTHNSTYFLGPVYLNGSELPEVTGIEISPGLNYVPTIASGDVFPRTGSIRSRLPTLRFTTDDGGLATAIGRSFLGGATNLVFYLRKGTLVEPSRVADDQSQHIKITMSTGALKPEDISVQGADDWSTALVGLPHAALASSLTSAIGA